MPTMDSSKSKLPLMIAVCFVCAAIGISLVSSPDIGDSVPQAASAANGTAGERDSLLSLEARDVGQQAADQRQPVTREAVSNAPSPRKAHHLEILIASSGAPAAGATIYHMAGAGTSPETLLKMLIVRDGKLPETTISTAAKYAADDRGKLKLFTEGRSSFVMAQLGDLVGYLALDSPYGHGDSIELRASRALSVKIEDEQGKASRYYPLEVEKLAFPRLFLPRQGRVSGAYVFYNCNTALAGVQRASTASGSTTVQVAAKREGRVMASAEVDLENPPADAISLQVPTGSNVSVRIVDLRGKPLRDRNFEIELEVETDLGPLFLTSSARPDRPAYFYGVPCVAKVIARMAKSEVAVAREDVTGFAPSFGGSLLELTIATDKNKGSIVMGRLIAPNGSILRNTAYKWDFKRRGNATSTFVSSSMGASGVSDGAGFVRINGQSFFRLNRKEDSVTSIELRANGKDGIPLFSDLPVQNGLITLPLDFGDIHMQHAQLLASGKVVDQKNRPIQGAAVTIFAAAQMAADARPVGQQECLATDENGDFAVYGKSVSTDLFADASAEGYGQGLRLPHAPGATGLKITLQKAGSISGSLRLADLRGRAMWRVGIRPLDEQRVPGFAPRKTGYGVSGSFTRDGLSWQSLQLYGDRTKPTEFGWEDLSEGSYAVGLWTDNINGSSRTEHIHTWDNLQVLSGEVLLDAAMQAYDPAAAIQALGKTRMTLLVLDEEGRRIPEATRETLPTELVRFVVGMRDGESTIQLDGTITEVLIAAPGFVSRTVPVQSGTVLVALKRAK